MLTPGNHKLGRSLIWSFSLPSGTSETCLGMTPTCRTACYAASLECFRPAAAARYRRNLALSHGRGFAARVRAFLVAHAIRVVRVHVGGDFYSPRYARAWLRVMRRSSRTLFYFYTRSWRVAAVKEVIDRMAELPNCRVWYSLDRDTGLPAEVPPGVRLAWLMTTPDDVPPSGTNLVFRVRRLRSQPAEPEGPTVCPAEDGVKRSRRMTCDRCGHCWRPERHSRTPLPVIEPDSERGDR